MDGGQGWRPRCKTGPSFETIVNFSGTKIDLREDKPTLQALSENNQLPLSDSQKFNIVSCAVALKL